MTVSTVLVVTSLLRARGGISTSGWADDFYQDSSPRTRRYFPVTPDEARALLLFSAHAEAFPKGMAMTERWNPLLRARGGISSGGAQ